MFFLCSFLTEDGWGSKKYFFKWQSLLAVEKLIQWNDLQFYIYIDKFLDTSILRHLSLLYWRFSQNIHWWSVNLQTLVLELSLKFSFSTAKIITNLGPNKALVVTNLCTQSVLSFCSFSPLPLLIFSVNHCNHSLMKKRIS